MALLRTSSLGPMVRQRIPLTTYPQGSMPYKLPTSTDVLPNGTTTLLSLQGRFYSLLPQGLPVALMEITESLTLALLGVPLRTPITGPMDLLPKTSTPLPQGTILCSLPMPMDVRHLLETPYYNPLPLLHQLPFKTSTALRKVPGPLTSL